MWLGNHSSWCNGAVIGLLLGNHSSWCNGAMEQWSNGAMEQWSNGAVNCILKSLFCYVSDLIANGDFYWDLGS